MKRHHTSGITTAYCANCHDGTPFQPVAHGRECMQCGAFRPFYRDAHPTGTPGRVRRALAWIREKLWIWLAALAIGLLMSHERALIDDGAELIAEDVSDAIASAQQAATPQVRP